MKRTTPDRLRPPPSTPGPLCERPAAVDRLARSTAIHGPGWEQDNHQAVVSRPGPVLTAACDELRPLPPGLNPLGVKEATVNRAKPVTSSSFLPASPLGPPPPPISYRGGDRGGGGRFVANAGEIRPARLSPSVGGSGHEIAPTYGRTARRHAY
jgi:hypothetical protein